MLFNWKCLKTLLETVLSSDLFLMVYHVHYIPPHYLTDYWLGHFFYIDCLLCNIILKCIFSKPTIDKLSTSYRLKVLVLFWGVNSCHISLDGKEQCFYVCITQHKTPHSSTFWLATVIWKPIGLFRCKENDIRSVPSCTI